MPGNINEKQNEKSNIRLLAAQRQIYTIAKRLRRYRVAITILLAITVMIVFLFVDSPDLKTGFAVVGFFWLVINRYILESIEARKIQEAANVQEQFDVALFALPWNKVLVENKVDLNIICAADRRFKGDRSKLENWYADTGRTTYPMNILLCQRSNLAWDWRLRRQYAWVIIGILIGFFMIESLVAIVTKQYFLDSIVKLIIPSLPAYLLGIDTAMAHLKSATERENLNKEIDDIWNNGLVDEKTVTLESCRAIQDKIFLLRRKGPLVPDNWYDWLRDNYQVDMESMVNELKSQADKAQSNKEG